MQLVAGAEAIDWGRVVGAEVIGLTAAASTPESSVAEVVAALGGRFALEVEEVEAARETMVFRPVAIGGAARALP